MQSVPFAPIAGETMPPSLAGLDVQLRADAEQHLDEALAFTFEIRNAGPETAAVHNPYDVLSYQLVDGEGWPIGNRAPASRIKTGGRLVDRSGYLRITSMQRDGLPVTDIDAQVAENTLTLDPGGSATWYLRVENVVPPPQKEGPTSIVSGNYSLSCVLSLLSALDEEPRSAVLQSGSVEIRVLP